MKKVAIELAKITAYVTTIVLVMCVLLTMFANKANAQAFVPVDVNGKPWPAVVTNAEPREETILYIESWNAIDTFTVDSRGLYCVKFTENRKKYALDFITKKEFERLSKRLASNRKDDIDYLLGD